MIRGTISHYPIVSAHEIPPPAGKSAGVRDDASVDGCHWLCSGWPPDWNVEVEKDMSFRQQFRTLKWTVESGEFALQFLEDGYGWFDLFLGGASGATSKY